MKNRIELLAPGGDVKSIKAAIIAGADAVYCGLDRFNARNRAENISFDELQGVIRFAHKHNCLVYLTLNIIILESEFPALIKLLNKLVNTSINGIIVQDLGVLFLVTKYYPSLKTHASTQLTTHNEGQIKFLDRLGIERVNLSREMNIAEVRDLTRAAGENNMQTEVFVHGSYCISFSGLCYMSSVFGGRSGNRGTCSQPCRDLYETTQAGKNYPLNLKDNSAYFDLDDLADAGVNSLKIEGRIKKFDYVYTVARLWRKRLNNYHLDQSTQKVDNSDLYKVFNRDYSNGFLKGDINRDMFIDNPRDFSIARKQSGFYMEQEKNRSDIENLISKVKIEKAPLNISISGKAGNFLKISVRTADTSFEVHSQIKLAGKGNEVLDRKQLMKRLKAINETEYFIKDLDLDRLEGDVYLPFKELTDLRNRLLSVLIGSAKNHTPVIIPALKKSRPDEKKTELSILISSENDIGFCQGLNAEIYFQLPDSFKNEYTRYKNLFGENESLNPWFPPILIGEDYKAAVNLLTELSPEKIVTNNSGIAYEAWRNGIPWIAGPFMNIVNSYSLLSLKENFSCSGAFISNEINESQIKSIRNPDNFDLYYSVHHPILLMISRQCLFHQVTGCEKSSIDDSCITDCSRTTRINNTKGNTSIIEKSKGNYHRIYADRIYMNSEIIINDPGVFSRFLIDLRDIPMVNGIDIPKSKIIDLFIDLINDDKGRI